MTSGAGGAGRASWDDRRMCECMAKQPQRRAAGASAGHVPSVRVSVQVPRLQLAQHRERARRRAVVLVQASHAPLASLKLLGSVRPEDARDRDFGHRALSGRTCRSSAHLVTLQFSSPAHAHPPRADVAYATTPSLRAPLVHARAAHWLCPARRGPWTGLSLAARARVHVWPANLTCLPALRLQRRTRAPRRSVTDMAWLVLPR